MCYNPIILQQYYDSSSVYHCYYYADYDPDYHTKEVLDRLSYGLAREGMHRHKFVVVPCGKCKECRARNARDWKIRLYHHSLTAGDGVFITLTYDNDHMDSSSLDYRHFQLFMKRLRRRFPEHKLSFFCAGEYGSKSLRRHFHCIVFGLPFNKIKSQFLCRSRKAKDIKIYTSEICSLCWSNRGFCSVSKVLKGDYRVFGYVSGYIISKSDEEHQSLISQFGLTPEFHHMSLKPAIGKEYFLQNYKTIYYSDCVCINGNRFRPPLTYDKWYQELTSRYIIREGVTGFGLLDILRNIKDVRVQMAYIFKLEDPFAFFVDKISDFDIIKSRRRKSFPSSFTCYNFESRKYNCDKYLLNCRDLYLEKEFNYV